MANRAAALLSGETDLNAFEITVGQSWQAQIEGAYNYLFPYIARDFRLNIDCDLYHQNLATIWASIPPSKGHVHVPYVQLNPTDTSNQQVNRTNVPEVKTGGNRIDTFNA